MADTVEMVRKRWWESTTVWSSVAIVLLAAADVIKAILDDGRWSPTDLVILSAGLSNIIQRVLRADIIGPGSRGAAE